MRVGIRYARPNRCVKVALTIDGGGFIDAISQQEVPRMSTIAIIPKDREALRKACRKLEHPSLAARLTSKLGLSIEKFFELLPDSWYESLHDAMRVTLEKSLHVAIYSLASETSKRRHNAYHKFLSACSGAAAGLFGLPAVLAELPVTSTIILRSIADIARSEGEDLTSLESRLACVEVFAMGGRSHEDEGAETGYYGIRLMLSMHFSMIPEQVTNQGIVKWSPPALVRLIAEIAARFGVVVTEKAALQMVPVLGAATGALVNLVFLEHFQDIARAHFTIRRLERAYGEKLIRSEYGRLTRRED